MRSIFCFLLLGAPLLATDFTVHEWGTFTSMVGSDGKQLSGLQTEEEFVPSFVQTFSGFWPLSKGFIRPVSGVTVKMETPVLYFYSDQPLSARVAVQFHGGSISQWYPERTGGEQMATPPEAEQDRLKPIDFSRGHEGSAIWNVDVLPHDTTTAISARHEMETPQWPRARVASANRVQTVNGDVEGFIFYRGLGHFSLPLKVTAAADGTLTLRNEGQQSIPFVWVYRKEKANTPAESWTGALPAGETQVATKLSRQEVAFAQALTTAGLNAEEAKALMATWRESYFDRPGLRVFWIVPREFTDAILPLEITPSPNHLERVLVGRTEVLTPTFEKTLSHDFAKNNGKVWQASRYFLAYQERVQQLSH